MNDLMVDEDRLALQEGEVEMGVRPRERRMSTGILVRALRSNGRPGAHDITVLDKASLLACLTSNGLSNPLAENVVGILLGHGHLHASPA